MRLFYRARQFWNALTARPSTAGFEKSKFIMGPSLHALFMELQPSEQAHSLKVLDDLEKVGEDHPDLLAAALLHDVGKARDRLRIWDRILIVIGKRFFPRKIKTWSQEPARGWRRAFVIAEQHPAWGAEMVRQAGASPLLISLVRRHQDEINGELTSEEDRLLRQLQKYDNEN